MSHKVNWLPQLLHSGTIINTGCFHPGQKISSLYFWGQTFIVCHIVLREKKDFFSFLLIKYACIIITSNLNFFATLLKSDKKLNSYIKRSSFQAMFQEAVIGDRLTGGWSLGLHLVFGCLMLYCS